MHLSRTGDVFICSFPQESVSRQKKGARGQRRIFFCYHYFFNQEGYFQKPPSVGFLFRHWPELSYMPTPRLIPDPRRITDWLEQSDCFLWLGTLPATQNEGSVSKEKLEPPGVNGY